MLCARRGKKLETLFSLVALVNCLVSSLAAPFINTLIRFFGMQVFLGFVCANWLEKLWMVGIAQSKMSLPFVVHNDTLAERSKAVAQGAIPKGRGFEPHRCHFCQNRFARKVLQVHNVCKNCLHC